MGQAPGTLERKLVQNWLSRHRQFRMATDADCDCAADIKQMRAGYGGAWKAIPGYHPYFATGDFNGDGIRDFAVAVVDRSKATNNFALLVFNGPIGAKRAHPAFIKRDLDLRHQGLVYGPPRPKPYRLVVGRFEAEGRILEPHGRSYTLEW